MNAEIKPVEAFPVSANPFGGQVVAAPSPSQGGALVEVEQQRALAEVQSSVILAKKFPRDPISAMDRILNACARPTLAERATYAYSRGGAEVTGPSIRLAEAIAQNWGNVQFGIRELDQRPGVSTVEAFAWDLETNVRQSKVFQVVHERSTKKGKYRLEDPRDIYEMVANNGARRLRACILGIIPGDVTEAAVSACQKTIESNFKITPDSIKALVESFAIFGVDKEMIEKFIQRRVESILPAQVVRLRGVYTSLNDRMSVPADWFEVPEPIAEAQKGGKTPKAEQVKNLLDAQAPEVIEGGNS